MKVILLGPPGSGKGTQAAGIARELGVTLVASGELFRDHQRRGTELGRLAGSYMERGVYVPDDVTIKMIMERLDAPERKNGFVLDGFPRTLAQAQALDRELDREGGIDVVLYIDVPRDELTRRLTGRAICRDCQTPYHEQSSQPARAGRCDRCGGELYQREDDKAEVVDKRIQVYVRETEPVVDYYRQANKLKEIDGEGSVTEVGEALIAAVGRPELKYH